MPDAPTARDLEEFFAGRPLAAELFEVLRPALESAGPSEIRVTRSQVAFSRRRGFAWVWIPDRYLDGHRNLAPLVLSVALSRHDRSSRWKQVVEPVPGRWMHHLEVWRPADVDDEVRRWIAEAWSEAA